MRQGSAHFVSLRAAPNRRAHASPPTTDARTAAKQGGVRSRGGHEAGGHSEKDRTSLAAPRPHAEPRLAVRGTRSSVAKPPLHPYHLRSRRTCNHYLPAGAPGKRKAPAPHASSSVSPVSASTRTLFTQPSDTSILAMQRGNPPRGRGRSRPGRGYRWRRG